MSTEERRIREKGEQPAATEFVRLLEYLKSSRGFDFSGYKISSLMRRVQKRMQQVGVASYNDYIDFLEVHPDEFPPLFNTVLINVTGFFRDPQAWEVIAEQILPRILEGKGPEEPDPLLERRLRLGGGGLHPGHAARARRWATRSSGERVKIYATDVDEDALGQARQGSYTAAQVEDVPQEMLASYFELVGDRHVFRTDLRRSLIFGRHDLVQDAAISRLDLLICRNTLMYFNSETQAKILARFHFALNRTGYLFLGKAETLLSHSNSFRPEDLKSRVFQRAPNANLRERLLALTPATSSGDHHGANRPRARARGGLRRRTGGPDRGGPQGAPGAGQREGPPAVQPQRRRPRPPAAGPGDLLPPGRAALPHRDDRQFAGGA